MELITQYENKLNEYVCGLSNENYIFEITKLCGYGCFLPVNKNVSLVDLHNTVSLYFQRDIIELFFLNCVTNEKIKVPITSQSRIRDFLCLHNSGASPTIKPIYPVPCQIVYKLYLDDGHTHLGQSCHLIT